MKKISGRKSHGLVEKQVAAFARACRAAGFRVTHQRLEIFRALAQTTDHPCAETLHKRLRQRIPVISLYTVYRTLATLAGHGFINKVETRESQARYEAVGMQHHHLICHRCREIIDFQWPALDQTVLPEKARSWGQIDSKTVVAHGVCRKCID
jgi:Fur family peroxide stress response transcriptional regulator